MDETPGPLEDTHALAKHLGLSRWAVSRALNDQPGVSAETRARVRAAVAAAGFEPNVHARGLRGGTGPERVLIALPGLRDPAWTFVAGGLCEGLIIRGLQPFWLLGGGEPADVERAWSQAIAQRATAALVLGAHNLPSLGAESSSPGWRELQKRGVPVLFVEPREPGGADEVPVVRLDHRAAAALVVSHLRSAGHRRIALRGFGDDQQHRVKALLAACEVRGVSCETLPDPTTRFFVTPSPNPGQASSRRKLAKPSPATPPRGSSPKPSRRGGSADASSPTAIVAADDLTAFRLVRELQSQGRTVPGDCSLVGHGDEPAGALFSPALTTVDPQRSQLIARTLELFDELRRDPTGIRAGSLWVAPLLRCRGSVSNVTMTDD